MRRNICLFALLASLAACGGGGSGSSASSSGGSFSSGGSSSSGSGSSNSYTAGVFLPESTFAAHCAAPRSGKDPVTGVTYPDVAGTSTDENNFLRSWTNDLYLWFSEVPDLDPSKYTTAASYFPLLKTSATTPSGAAKDKFHFTYATSTWEQLSQAGASVGYGAILDLVSDTPPRKVIFAYVQTGSPAANAAIARGATVTMIDSVSIDANDQTSIDTLNKGLSPSTAGESHTFTIQDTGQTTTRTVTLTAAKLTEITVPVVKVLPTSAGNVGYLLFTQHLATSEQELVTAFNSLKSQNLTDLVLDLRYNGGGYLDVASETAYMIAGTATAGRTFELTQFNSKHPSTDPVTGQSITPVGFHSTSQGFSVTAGQALPTLNLQRVFVLTAAETCSASESIINSLRGINVQVIQVGSTTCGKPYGFYPQDNCGTTYFSIEFRGVNDAGFGDYPDGFSPQNTASNVGVTVPGCSVGDDFTHALGDTGELMLSTALSYRMSPSCPAPTGVDGLPALKRQARGTAIELALSPLRQNRILRRQ